MTRSPRRFLFIATVSASSLVAYAGMLLTQREADGLLHGPSLLRTVGWAGLAFVAYLAAVIWNERHGRSTKWIWIGAIGFRLVLVWARPALSDDIYRYIWDGHLARSGVSPYAYVVDSPELDYLEIPQRSLVNHSWMASPYLPGAQLLFWAVSFAGPSRPLYYQLIMVVFDLLSASIIARLMAAASLPSHRILIYLWNPLIIVEVAYSAHVDALMVFLTLAAVYLTLMPLPAVEATLLPANHAGGAASRNWSDFRRSVRTLLAPVLLAVAALTKLLPILLLPIFFWRWSWRQRGLFGVSFLILLVPSGMRAGWGLSGALDGTGVFGALRIFADQWNFNSGLFHWLERWLGAPGYGAPDPAAKMAVLVIMAFLSLAVMILARRPMGNLAVLRLSAVPLIASHMLATTVNPWYALTLLGFLPFLSPAPGEHPKWWLSTIPWIYFSGALFLSYLTYLDPFRPAELEWVRLVEWLPTLALLASFLLAEAAMKLIAWRSSVRASSAAVSPLPREGGR